VADLQLELYIAGQSRNSLAAVSNLRRLCEHELRGKYDLRVVDILEHPQAAEAANILATPTLIKRAPPPLRRIVGDLSLTSVVLAGLDIDEDGHEA
jgi:circadian clock protein KaiB